MRLSKMVEIENDPSLPRGVSCRLIMTMKDGKKMEAQVDYPKGSVRNPMTESERFGKFEALSQKWLDDQQPLVSLQHLLGTDSYSGMTTKPISSWVNNPKHNDRRCLNSTLD